MTEKAKHNALTQAALKRIGEYETFLESCGITPVAGSELEFHLTAQQSPNYRKLWDIKEFKKSPFVEMLVHDDTISRVGEVVIGKGPESHHATRPKERYPSTIARVTNSARQIIEDGGSKYGMDITFGEKESGKRIRSLQCNVSLWNSGDKTPLFAAEGVLHAPNALTHECTESLIQAQQALSATVIPSEAAFRRLNIKSATFSAVIHDKLSDVTALVRKNTQGNPFTEGQSGNRDKTPSYYFEDRLPSSDADPALAMLMTLGGIATGVKNYMKKNGLVDDKGNPSPEKMKAHINSSVFKNALAPENTITISETAKRVYAPIPSHHRQALFELQNSHLAKEILGPELHADFVAAYEKTARTAAQPGVQR